MDTCTWINILCNLTAFATGLLFGRDTQIQLWISCMIYLVSLMLVYMIGYYIFDIKL